MSEMTFKVLNIIIKITSMVHLPYRSNLFFCSEEIESFENKLNTNHKNLKVKHMIVKKNNFQRKGKAINIEFYKKKILLPFEFCLSTK